MANNFGAKDATNTTQTFKSTDNAGVHTPHKNLDTIMAGASVDIGAVADAAVVTDANGSLKAHVRGLVKIFAERFHSSIGQKAMNASLPVVLASDQSAIPLSAGSAAIGGVKYNGPQWTVLRAQIDSADLSAIVDLTAAPGAGEKIVIDYLFISTLTAMTLTISEETTTTVMFKALLAANSLPVEFKPLGGRKLATVDKKARIQASAGGAIYVLCLYHSEA